MSPLKIAKLAKAGKLDGVIKLMDEILPARKQIGKELEKEIVALFFKYIDGFITVLEKGTEDVVKFIEDVYTAIRKWIDDTLNTVYKLERGFDKSSLDVGGIVLKRYIPRGVVYGQSKVYTCVATSLRMVLDTKRLKFSEDILAESLQTSFRGARVLDIPKVIELLDLKKIKLTKFENIELNDFIEILKINEIAIVSIRIPGKGLHSIVIDKISNGKFFLRDPLPLGKGSSYSINIEDFKYMFYKRVVIFH